MSYNCSKCNFTANFESALMMHKQLHHDTSAKEPPKITKKFNNVPSDSQNEQTYSIDKPKKSLRSLTRSSSATRLLDRIRVRLCKSRLLFSHPEETTEDNTTVQYKSPLKILEVKSDGGLKEISIKEKPEETFGCHLCSLEADRITVLDRHLLNDHKIGMENLLKLVMDKTKDGLADDSKPGYGTRNSYYNPSDEMIMETAGCNFKIFKHAASNTDLKWTDIPDDGFKGFKEREEIFDVSTGGSENRELFEKMRSLNEYMSRFLTSSKTLNKVLSKELSHKDSSRSNERSIRLGLGDQEPKERCFSEDFGRDRQRFEDNRNNKKYASEVYF